MAVGAGLALLPIGPAAGLSLAAAISFAIGLLVANVPEGLPPTITLALAVGVREMARRDARRRALFRFSPRIKLMTTVDQQDGGLVASTKGAPEEVLARATRIRRGVDEPPITAADRDAAARAMDKYARQGLRVLEFGRRTLPAGLPVPGQREDAERDLCLIGLVAMLDPPRPEVAAAIVQVHRAGIRVHVVTGDNGLTAAAIARRIGIGADEMRVVNGTELDVMAEHDLDELLGSGSEVVFARSSPEAKLRIADALRAQGQVVAMTGDGDMPGGCCAPWTGERQGRLRQAGGTTQGRWRP